MLRSNKKNFNNLFDSILLLLLELFIILLYVLVMLFGVIRNETPYKVQVSIICSAFFIPLIISMLIMLLLGCFEWWKIDNEYVAPKKLFRKKIQIEIGAIVSITEEVVPALILGTYKTDAIIIKSNTNKITIYLDKKKTAECIRNLLQSHQKE